MFSKAPVDLGSYEEATAWVEEAVAQLGGVDILYNNAGGTKAGPFMSGSVDDYRFNLRNALDVVVFPTRAAWPHLVARGGGPRRSTTTHVPVLRAEGTMCPIARPFVCPGIHSGGKRFPDYSSHASIQSEACPISDNETHSATRLGDATQLGPRSCEPAGHVVARCGLGVCGRRPTAPRRWSRSAAGLASLRSAMTVLSSGAGCCSLATLCSTGERSDVPECCRGLPASVA
jgi:hypothetical protein